MKLYTVRLNGEEYKLFTAFQKANLNLPCRFGEDLEIEGSFVKTDLESKIFNLWEDILDEIYAKNPYGRYFSREDFEKGLELYYIDMNRTLNHKKGVIELTFGPTKKLLNKFNHLNCWKVLINKTSGNLIDVVFDGSC